MAPDQSMDDILASIKRVMARDPLPSDAAPPRRRAEPPIDPDDVLELREQDRDALTSPATVQASRDKLQALDRVEPGAAAPHGTTVEALVAELMRPLLKNWLDEHLPAIVETAVDREVRRITRG